MKWLQWSRIDLARGLGGVEVHARSLARELTRLGVDCKLSNDPRDLEDSSFDVIQSHGSSLLDYSRVHPRAKKLLTLHGTTLGRMAACHEWTWVGGYLAASRETQAVLRADAVVAVHPKLHLYSLARKMGKPHAVCSNGWDSGEAGEPITQELERKLTEHGQSWLYIGRGGDPVKGADRLQATLKLVPDLKFAAAPGEGFENEEQVLKTGLLTPGQIRTLMARSKGLVLTSYYEGLPLVVLEALCAGLPVVATKVGGLSSLSTDGKTGLQGLEFTATGDPRAIADSLRAASRHAASELGKRASHNQALLPSWKQVAERTLRLLRSLEKSDPQKGLK